MKKTYQNKKKFKYAHIAVGQIKNYETRFKLYKDLKKYNFILPLLFQNFHMFLLKKKLKKVQL